MIHEEYLYQNIVFMQGDDDAEVFDIVNKNGHEDLLKYMFQWDTDEPGEVSRSPPWGTGDRIFIKREKDSCLVLSYNLRLSYCGLCRIRKGAKNEMVQNASRRLQTRSIWSD